MPLDTPPHDSTARSAHTHSTTVLARMEVHSPLAKPRLISPPAISPTACAVWFQVWLRHSPRCFWRSQTLGPRCLTAFQNMAGIVSPAITTSLLGWMLLRSQRLLIGVP